MANQKTPTPNRAQGDMIQCPICGERYSTTYRRCPFCDEVAPAPSSRSVGQGGSGKRVAGGSSRPAGRRTPPYLNQVIFILVTLAIIIAAIFIIFKTISPLFSSSDVEDDPSISTTVDPQPDVTPDVDIEPDVTPDVDPEPTVSLGISALVLSHSDVTLSAGESFTITTNLPADADAAITWSSSSPSATVSLTGVVTNTNTSGSAVAVTITATAGDLSAECVVRCKSGTASSTTTTTTTTTTGSGTAGVVHGTTTGLNVRSGPGTTYDIISSLSAGDSVSILDSADGWYQISFVSSSGVTITGYVSQSYIAAG